MKLVNIGCGTVYHAAWINLDSVPCGPDVQRCDAHDRLPFADGSIDAVYHSHMLEHLDAASARAFLAECRRVLKPGGIVRVAVPDLEGIARAYLRELDAARGGAESPLLEWSRMELTDQAARSVSGGAMAPFLRGLTPAQLDAVRARAGQEVDGVRAARGPRRITPGKIWRRLRGEFMRAIAWAVGGPRMSAAWDEGWFRQGGEVHRVMYDQRSLAQLLVAAGFSAPRKCAAEESAIPGFAAYELDAVAGKARKPDSLYMEAVRG